MRLLPNFPSACVPVGAACGNNLVGHRQPLYQVAGSSDGSVFEALTRCAL
jgi:hypothetical protein